MNESAAAQQTNPTYNGWSNYETWLGHLWLTNDEYNYSILCEALKLESGVYKKAEWLKRSLSWQLEDIIDETSLWQDLLNQAFSRIDWIEIIQKNLD